MPVIQSKFEAPFWARNPHIQTLLPRFMRKPRLQTLVQERLELPDGDFVDLIWINKAQLQQGPTVLVLHGLAGSIKSPYACHLLADLEKSGRAAVFMHFRGCSGEANRLASAYHAGQTEDMGYLVKLIRARNGKNPIYSVGFSLGANMLLNYLAQSPHSIARAVAIAPPLDLSACADRINHGFSRFYQWYLLRGMKRILRDKLHRVTWPDGVIITHKTIATLNSFWRYDDLVTAPLHGFSGVEHYYERSSAMRLLGHIKTPTLILHAKDDPFMFSRVIPEEHQLSSSITYELSERGGHVGFIGGTLKKPVHWMNRRIFEHLFS